MSSFFTVPGEKKRKRATASEAPKKRIAGNDVSYRSAKGSAGKKFGRPRDAAPSASSDALAKSGKKPTARRRKEEEKEDESVSGSDSDDDELAGRGSDDDDASDNDDSGDEDETAAERRLRLAERYLENVREEVKGAAGADGDIYAFDAEDVDRDLIAERLQEDVAESKGRVYRQLAGTLGFGDAAHAQVRWNSKNVNAVAVCAPYAYTVTSDVYLTKWRIQDRPEEQQRAREASRKAWEEEKAKRRKKNNNKKRKAKDTTKADEEEEERAEVPPRRQPTRLLYRHGNPGRRHDKDYRGHVGSILCVAASQDGKFVVTGGADKRMVVWDAEELKPLRVFTHHRDAVTGLAFRRGTNQLYSCSKDRTIKIWSLDELAYVQTLFGHQDEVTDIDALAQEKCVSVGTRDRTARMWKVIEETQLVFRGGGSGGKGVPAGVDPRSLAHEGSMDRVAMLDDELFVTGSDNGALALWSTQKKKPLSVIPRAHGIEPVLSGREQYDAAMSTAAAQAANPPPPPQPRWITALRTIPYSDIVLSGSWDGSVRVWCLSKDKRKLESLGALGGSDSKFSLHGVVNDIAAFERGERGRDGLSVVVAVGQEHRLGRWGRQPGARNCAVVFEIGRVVKKANGMNGVNGHAAESDEE
ncbi:pre-rRNA processing protein [Sporothrix eucalyptigena]|uniref:Pre-rRNA processing protein n=1 Tax=Sporothrix eucalyptigena TaxID=1812306 RepID=A0ABP0BGN4_9PEZI